MQCFLTNETLKLHRWTGEYVYFTSPGKWFATLVIRRWEQRIVATFDLLEIYKLGARQHAGQAQGRQRQWRTGINPG